MHPKTSIIIIGGGNSYKTDREYLKALNFYPPKLYDNHSDWKSTIFNTFSEFNQVLIPTMPSKDNAKYSNWKIVFEKVLKLTNDRIILIGHSLGGNFLQRYLSENVINKTIVELDFVAGCLNIGDFGEGKNWNQINNKADQINIWHSSDDKVVDVKKADYYNGNLPKSNIYIFEDRGHFNSPNFEELINNISNNLN